MNIKIKTKQYVLKYTLRAFFIFENTTGYPFKFGKMIDEYILFYSMLLANNESFDLLFEEFIAVCDESPVLFADFVNFALNEVNLQMQAAERTDADIKKKKKKR